MNWTRRNLLKTGASALAAASLLLDASESRPKGKADACILLWLGGGAAHLDTFDPKARSTDGRPGSFYDSIETAILGARVCEHLRYSAPLLDRCVLMRSLHHTISSEHGAAANLVHTGRMPSGTLQYPSIGSIVSHELGPKSEDVPAYVVMGYPNITRDPRLSRREIRLRLSAANRDRTERPGASSGCR
jgi:Protein of unknown function (DUF1501)